MRGSGHQTRDTFKEKSNFWLSNRHQVFRIERTHEYCILVGREVSTRPRTRKNLGNLILAARFRSNFVMRISYSFWILGPPYRLRANWSPRSKYGMWKKFVKNESSHIEVYESNFLLRSDCSSLQTSLIKFCASTLSWFPNHPMVWARGGGGGVRAVISGNFQGRLRPFWLSVISHNCHRWRIFL